MLTGPVVAIAYKSNVFRRTGRPITAVPDIRLQAKAVAEEVSSVRHALADC